MFQVRFHGRGGQGVVTAAELLSLAAFIEGKFSQAFPSFGPERTGAPVTAFCRIDTRRIRAYQPIMTPDAVVVEDATLVHLPEVLVGTRRDTPVLVNTSVPLTLPSGRVYAVAANEIAEKALGRRVPNAAMLGALARATNVVALDALVAALRARFRGDASDGNIVAARAAFEALAC